MMSYALLLYLVTVVTIITENIPFVTNVIIGHLLVSGCHGYCLHITPSVYQVSYHKPDKSCMYSTLF